jgi:hypothetical protein
MPKPKPSKKKRKKQGKKKVQEKVKKKAPRRKRGCSTTLEFTFGTSIIGIDIVELFHLLLR